MQYKFPKNTPLFARRILEETVSNVHSILKGNMIGAYLYGSLAMACFNPTSSDIDLIIVIRKRLAKHQGTKTIQYLKATSSKDRRIELSIVDMTSLQHPRYPMMVDLHYEHWGNIFENEEDDEILSNLYTTRKRGFRIWGLPIDDVFSKIPPSYHLKSVIQDIEHTRKYLHETPERAGYNIAVYWVLTSCRILAFIMEEKVLSKLEGGIWGLANLPKKHHDLIEQALTCYRSKKRDNGPWNKKELDAFADYMTAAILKESRLKEH